MEPDYPVHQELIEWVKKIAEASQWCYGCRRMKNSLNALGAVNDLMGLSLRNI